MREAATPSLSFATPADAPALDRCRLQILPPSASREADHRPQHVSYDLEVELGNVEE